jgi:hypothetical protein
LEAENQRKNDEIFDGENGGTAHERSSRLDRLTLAMTRSSKRHSRTLC